MESQGLECKPEQVSNLKGDLARCEFINKFKEIQRLKTQLDQYVDIGEEDNTKINELIPEETLQAFRGVYLEIAQDIKNKQDKNSDELPPEVQETDPEFILFASALIDYDYIMSLIAKCTQSDTSKKETMSKKELISYLSSSSNLLEEKDDIIEYINTLETGKGMSEDAIKAGYKKFKNEKSSNEILKISQKHGINIAALKSFIEEILKNNRFDGEKLTDLMEPLDLSWREKTTKELALMEDMVPLLKKMANGQEIIGLKAYE